MASGESSVAVIGAGPAGSAAARLLASWGHDVVVFARRGGNERALGESLPPSCVVLLERLGITGLDAAGFLRSSGNTVRWGSGEERVEQFAQGLHGYQVDRAAFDAFLVQQAKGAGADVRAGSNVTAIRRGDGATVQYEKEGKSESLTARWVLDCSGRTGIVARDGWRQPEPAARTTAIVAVWERDDEWPTPQPSHTLVESTEDGWAWSVPVSRRRRYVTLMVDPTITPVASREGLDRAYLEQLARTRSLSSLVEGAARVGPVFARDASPYTARTFGEAGTLLVGDAASFVDPLSSFGIKKALASAWLASVVVHSILLNGVITAAALELFNTRERGMYDALRRSAAELARDAAVAHPTAFWEARSAAVEANDVFEPDIAALRQDGDVLRSFEELRRRPAIRLRPTSFVRRASRPTVRSNRVVVEDHLVVPAFPDGVRYVRNIDLVRLSELAVAHDQVPDLFAAYNSVASPAPLPDFLGALSLLIGKGFLEWQVA
jgi:flavin-dependent dehydrogenase